jgi:multiple sugar transport system substrate-binding protein
MQELELSIMSRGADAASDLRPLLDQFEAQCRCHVRVRVLPWESAWADLVKMALYSAGTDVSEVGTNWVGNLMAMGALRPFHSAELNALGGASAFLDLAWQSGSVIGDRQMWAVPWLADTRLIYYRRDLLEKAGLSGPVAITSHRQLEQMLTALQIGAVASPWVMPTLPTANTLHNLASWVWGAGGNFVSVEGKRTLFNEARARSGFRAYLGLHRFLALQAQGLDARQSDAFYQQGLAAMTMSGPWLALVNLAQSPRSEAAANTGVALPLGVPFVGGSNLVIWKYTRRGKAALDLVRFLTSTAAQSDYCRRAGLLPVRLDVLNATPFTGQLPHRVMSQGVRAGRAFPAFLAWGLIEDSLTTEIAHLWAALRSDPALDLDAALAERLDPLAQRLDLTLSQTL